MTNFLKDEKGGLFVAAAIFLPFLFAFCALSFDLGFAIINQSRLSDSLRESALLYSQSKEPIEIEEKIKNMAKIYTYGEEIDNIQVKHNTEESGIIQVSANFSQAGFFGGFISNDSQNTEIKTYAKYQNDSLISKSDYIFTIGFTQSSALESSLNKDLAKKICSRDNAKLIEHGFCNPPLGEIKAIDAAQSIIAYSIKMAKTFDRDNSQKFGFIPYTFGVQIKGEDLPKGLKIDTQDGLTQEERNKATYVVYPLELSKFPNFKNYDIYSRFYPTSILHNESKYMHNIYKEMEALGIDLEVINVFKDQDVSTYLLRKFAIKEDNKLLDPYSKSDFNEAKMLIDAIDSGLLIGYLEHLNTDATIKNITSEENMLTYRLYNPSVDTITLNSDLDTLKENAKKLDQLQGNLASLRAILDILEDMQKNPNLYPAVIKPLKGTLSKKGIQSAFIKYAKVYLEGENAREIAENVSKYFYVTWSIKDTQKALEGDIETIKKLLKPLQENTIEKALITAEFTKQASSSKNCQGDLFCFFNEEYEYDGRKGGLGSVFDEIFSTSDLDRAIKELGMNKPEGYQPPKEAGGEATLADIVANDNLFYELKNEKERLEGVLNDEQTFYYVKLCESIPQFEDEKQTQIHICTKSEYGKQKYKEQKELKVKIKAEYEKAKDAYDGFVALKARFENIEETPQSALAQIRSELEQKQTMANQLLSTLEEGITIKGKALCNSFLSNSLGGSCQTSNNNEYKFHEIKLRKIQDQSEIKEIDMINEIPFSIASDRLGKRYLTSTPPDRDFTSVALIRAAQMLLNSQDLNPNANILIFSTSVNKVDDQLFRAGLCRAIKDTIKVRKGVDVNIYALGLGLPKAESLRPSNDETYKKLWRKCTDEDKIILGENIDHLLNQISANVFGKDKGKFYYDEIR